MITLKKAISSQTTVEFIEPATGRVVFTDQIGKDQLRVRQVGYVPIGGVLKAEFDGRLGDSYRRESARVQIPAYGHKAVSGIVPVSGTSTEVENSSHRGADQTSPRHRGDAKHSSYCSNSHGRSLRGT